MSVSICVNPWLIFVLYALAPKTILVYPVDLVSTAFFLKSVF